MDLELGADNPRLITPYPYYDYLNCYCRETLGGRVEQGRG